MPARRWAGPIRRGKAISSDPRSDPEYLILYLLTCDGAGGLLDRVQRWLIKIVEGPLTVEEFMSEEFTEGPSIVEGWMTAILTLCQFIERQLEQGIVEPNVLIPRTKFLQTRMRVRCNHHFRRVVEFDSYTGDPIRECSHCKLVVLESFVPDARCDRCDGPVWRKGAHGPILRFCSVACQVAAWRVSV